MRKKKQQTLIKPQKTRQKRTPFKSVGKADSIIIDQCKPFKNHPDNHYNKHMRVIFDVDDLKKWLKSVNDLGKTDFGICPYFIGQQCERLPEDIFISEGLDLTNMFFANDSDNNKIKTVTPNFKMDNSHEEKTGKGIIVRVGQEENYNTPRKFILFEDLYKVRYSYSQIIKNAILILKQFERVTHYPMNGICIKIIDQKLKATLIKHKIETIINFKI